LNSNCLFALEFFYLMISLVSFVITISFSYFFFNDTATTEIYTLPTRRSSDLGGPAAASQHRADLRDRRARRPAVLIPGVRSEEHTSELQSRSEPRMPSSA